MADSAAIGRRELLRRAAMALGVSALSPALASAVMAGVKPDAAAKPRFLSPRELQLVGVLVDLILPATDTPGAKAAGVHQLIDVLLADYFSRAHREKFMAGLAGLDAAAREKGAESFVDADVATQTAILRVLDSHPYDLARPPKLTFFQELKELTLGGYYTSEVGATRELRYEPIPGAYRGCVPYAEIGRAWAVW